MAKISDSSGHSDAAQKETRDQYGKFTKVTSPSPAHLWRDHVGKIL